MVPLELPVEQCRLPCKCWFKGQASTDIHSGTTTILRTHLHLILRVPSIRPARVFVRLVSVLALKLKFWELELWEASGCRGGDAGVARGSGYE